MAGLIKRGKKYYLVFLDGEKEKRIKNKFKDGISPDG
jgi:hypothetical protein